LPERLLQATLLQLLHSLRSDPKLVDGLSLTAVSLRRATDIWNYLPPG